MERDLQKLHDTFAARLAKANRLIAAFEVKMAEKGLHNVLGGSDHLFEAAGEVEVYGQLVKALTKKLSGDPTTKLDFDSLYDYTMREVVNKAAWVSHGSSQTGYLLKRCETAAWARALTYMQTGM